MSTLTSSSQSSQRSPRRTRQARERAVAPTSVTLALEQAAARARRERTITGAVRAAWDVVVAGPACGRALASSQSVHRHDGPAGELFAVACLAGGSPAGVAGSLHRAAAIAAGSGPEGAVT